MSIRLMLAREPLFVVLYGYDEVRDTLFAQLREVRLDGNEDFPPLWLGLTHRITRASTIAEKLRPWADFGPDRVLELESDRAQALKAAPRSR